MHALGCDERPASYDLFELLCALAGPCRLGIFKQIVAQLGSHMDKQLVDSMGSIDGKDVYLSTANPFQQASDIEMEQRVYAHREACRAHFGVGNKQFFSWSGDKRRVGNLAINNHIGATPDNVCFPMAPQFLFVVSK